MEFKNIKNLIFDLGGVIIDIDPTITFSYFAKQTGRSVEEINSILFNQEIWQGHEKGIVSDSDFRNHIKENYLQNHSEIEIDKTWNSLLLNIPKERIELLLKLKNKYKIYLLSNTNAIHIQQVNVILQHSIGIATFEQIFDKVYYSYQIGLRKPDPNIYTYVLNSLKINAFETLFIDDNLENIIAANTLGIKTIHVTPPHTIIELLQNA